jgi:uncharacterized protein YegP (UPF0339 family)
MHIELFQSKDGWRWRLMGRNGRILATSESYSSRGMCRKTVARVLAAGFTGKIQVKDG